MGRKILAAFAVVGGLSLSGVVLGSGRVPITGWNLDKWGTPHLGNSLWECPKRGVEGRYLTSWTNGNKKMKGTCTGGVATDKWQQWHENGELMWQGAWEGGLPTGTWKSYYDNGKKWARGSFDKGLRTGEFSYWHDNGELWAEGEWMEDKEAGCWVVYYSNGELAIRGAYVDGEKVGKWLYWDEQGNRRPEIYGGEETQGKCFWNL